MKIILFYIIGSLLIFDVMARDSFNLNFKPGIEDFLEKEKLLPLVSSYINNAFIQKDAKKVFGLYRKQSSAENEIKLLAILKAQLSLLEGQEIKSLVLLDAKKTKPDNQKYSSEATIDFQLETLEFKIPIKLVFLLDPKEGWCLQEKLNIK
jgi:hypothetical protein